MAAPVRARQAAPAQRARPQQPRRQLQLVTDARLRDAARRRRVRMLVVATCVIVVAALFGLAAFNAMLVSGQDRLDGLRQKVTEAQAQYSANRLKVAELEAPGHVVQVAQDRLGMVPPPGVTYLSPSQAMTDEVGGTPAHSEGTGEDDGGTSWAAVKPYLAGRP